MGTLLSREGRRTRELPDGKRMARRRLLARQMWDALETGTIIFMDGTTRRLSARDWMELVNIVFDRIDGKVPQPMQHSGPDGEAILIKMDV